MAESAESVVLSQFRKCVHCMIFGSILAKVGSGIFLSGLLFQINKHMNFMEHQRSIFGYRDFLHNFGKTCLSWMQFYGSICDYRFAAAPLVDSNIPIIKKFKGSKVLVTMFVFGQQVTRKFMINANVKIFMIFIKNFLIFRVKYYNTLSKVQYTTNLKRQ